MAKKRFVIHPNRPDVYLIHHADDTLSIKWSKQRPNLPSVGGFGSYRSMLNHYMSFTERVDRLRIRTDSDDQLMECIDAVHSLVGRRPTIRLTGGAATWFIDLLVGELAILHLSLSADHVVRTSLEAFLNEEGYEVTK